MCKQAIGVDKKLTLHDEDKSESRYFSSNIFREKK